MPETELHKAARDGDVDSIEMLCTQGLNVNEKGAQGRTPLHRALGGANVEAVRLLISKGADATIVDSLKRNSLHWAAMGPPPGNVECCEILFEQCENFPAMMAKETKSGSTPLHSAVSTNRTEVVRFLIEKEADTTKTDEDGFTPYQLAKVRRTSPHHRMRAALPHLPASPHPSHPLRPSHPSLRADPQRGWPRRAPRPSTHTDTPSCLFWAECQQLRAHADIEPQGGACLADE